MNFIIPIYSYITPTCSCIDAFTTTYRRDIACYGNYEIHSDNKIKDSINLKGILYIWLFILKEYERNG